MFFSTLFEYDYSFSDNVLYRYIPGNIQGAEVVIKGREGSIISEFHDGAFGGHSGVNKTIAAIKIRYWWLGLTDDVKAYVSFILLFI